MKKNKKIGLDALKEIISQGNWETIEDEVIWNVSSYTPADEGAAKILAYASSLLLPSEMKRSVYKDAGEYFVMELAHDSWLADCEPIESYAGGDADVLDYCEIVCDWDRAATDEELALVECFDPYRPDEEDDRENRQDESRRDIMKSIIRALLVKDFADEL